MQSILKHTCTDMAAVAQDRYHDCRLMIPPAIAATHHVMHIRRDETGKTHFPQAETMQYTTRHPRQ